jgi:hypothetical protein
VIYRRRQSDRDRLCFAFAWKREKHFGTFLCLRQRRETSINRHDLYIKLARELV